MELENGSGMDVIYEAKDGGGGITQKILLFLLIGSIKLFCLIPRTISLFSWNPRVHTWFWCIGRLEGARPTSTGRFCELKSNRIILECREGWIFGQIDRVVGARPSGIYELDNEGSLSHLQDHSTPC